MTITNGHTSNYIKDVRSNGRYAFILDDVYKRLTKGKKNIRKDIDRLVAKGDIQNIRSGFYIVIPDEYRNMGTLPVELYIDDLMKHLQKQYYIGLYSAAMYHGAAHQQPQEFYVISESPKLRNIKKNKLSINFSEKTKYPEFGITTKKTETGYMNISNIELTFFDLLYYENRLGGLNRISTILDELSEEIQISKLKEVLKNEFPLTIYQRAGYILEHVLYKKKLANILEKKIINKAIKTTLLKPSGKNKGEIDDKWKVQVNVLIESDL